MQCFADFDSLRAVCVTRPLRDKMVIVKRIPESRAIQVHNIHGVTEEVIGLYFENNRSGCNKVTHIQLCQEDDYALVEVADSASEFQLLYQVMVY